MNQSFFNGLWNTYKWPISLHILFGMLAIMFIFWVLFNILHNKNAENALKVSGKAMIGFIAFIAVSWFFIIVFSREFFRVVGQEHPYYKLLLLLSQVKGMLFVVIPLYSFIIYLEFSHVINTGITSTTNIIKTIKWQIITIIVMLTINALTGFLFMYYLESLTGATP